MNNSQNMSLESPNLIKLSLHVVISCMNLKINILEHKMSYLNTIDRSFFSPNFSPLE